MSLNVAEIEYVSLFDVEGEMDTRNPIIHYDESIWCRECRTEWEQANETDDSTNVAIISDFDHDAAHIKYVCICVFIKYILIIITKELSPKMAIVQVSASRCPSICERIIVSLCVRCAHSIRTLGSSIFYRDQWND